MASNYSDEKNAQIILSLLKKHGIRKVIASPGTTNMALTVSMQYDSYFEVYSSVDERSAAYMACGLAEECAEPVVITCTGATASRNYLPGLTEAYYRKLPILSITSTNLISKIGHLTPQVIDRSELPKDVVNHTTFLPVVTTNDDFWNCEIKVNEAILALFRNGGGPVHIDVETNYGLFTTKKLPVVRFITRLVNSTSEFPKIPEELKIGIFIGAHSKMSKELERAIDSFCASHDAVVFCDHSSGYHGKYKVLSSLLMSQVDKSFITYPDLIIHIGEVTGDYFGMGIVKNEVWRVSEDGEIRDTFKKLTKVFEMSELNFFEYYTKETSKLKDSYLQDFRSKYDQVSNKFPELPFSNIWVASQLVKQLPENSVIHFAILNSLRSWNFFELPNSVTSSCNVGGFGIDGCMSSLIGASLYKKDKLYFLITGDLAFFYDMNVLGNRHLGNNIRILLVNNGVGTEFRQFNHRAAQLGDDSNEYVAAAGHFGKKSRDLINNYSQNLGFEYISASTKEKFNSGYEKFIDNKINEKPILFEIFTNNEDESEALEKVLNIMDGVGVRNKAKKIATHLIGANSVKNILKTIKK